MNTKICQSFAQRFMGQCLVYALAVLKSEWSRYDFLKFWQHSTVELKQIRFPCAVWINPVNPSLFSCIKWNFLVVRKKPWHTIFIADGIIFAEHQHPGNCEPLFSRFPVFAVTTQFAHKVFIRQQKPWVAWFGNGKKSAILRQ